MNNLYPNAEYKQSRWEMEGKHKVKLINVSAKEIKCREDGDQFVKWLTELFG